MNQRTFLGLTHNPFEPPREGFYSGADRKTHLDHMLHLSEWSRRILVVTGPLGVGKTSLFRELSNNLEANVRGARLSGNLVTTEREVVTALLQGFGLPDPHAHIEQQCDAIMAQAADRMANDLVCMAMVDDAHLLENQALNRLVALVAACPMRLVIFAEAEVVNRLDRAARRYEVDWYEIRLTGFPAADVRGYLEWRFRQAHYRGRLPFTDDQVKRIVERSGGNPGRVDALANQVLLDMQSGEFRKRAGFPATHLTLVLVMAVAVGLTYMVMQTDEQTLQPEIEAMPLPDLPAATVVLEQRPPPTPPADELPEPQSENLLELEAEPEEVEAPPPAPSPTTIDPVVVQPPTEPREIPPVVESVAREIDSPTLKSGDWLLAQDPGRFTLQLITVSSLERAESFVRRQADPSEFAIYRLHRNGSTLYVVTYGVFSSQQAASAAAASLSGELARLKPWIRAMSLVQDAIRSSR